MLGEKTKANWIEQDNPLITDFFEKLYAYIFKHYKMSLFNRYNETSKRGCNSNWLTFSDKGIGLTGKGISIIVKFNQQETGIEFSGMGDKVDYIRNKFKCGLDPMFADGACLEKRGKSASLFYKLKPIDVEKPFEDQEENINDALLKTQKLLFCMWKLRDDFGIKSSPF